MRFSRAVRSIQSTRFAVVVALLPAVVATTKVGQAPLRVFDKPQIELAEPFTNVGSVRELRDGRVVLQDNGDRALYVVDFAAGTSTQIGRPGSGPAEYRMPGVLLPMAGDTTFVPDAGNQRIFVIGPDARPVATLSDAWPQLEGRGTRLPRAVDGRGRGYFVGAPVRAPVESGPVIQVDSVALYRTPRGAPTVDSIGIIHLAPRKITTESKDGKLTGVSIVTPPLPAQDGWQAFADGAVAIVRVRDYRVEWILPTGERVIGKPIPFEPVKVTELDEQRAVGAGRGRTGGGGAAPNAVLQLDWPNVKPPFPFTGVLAGPDGRLWVQRHGPATDRRTHYDIVDRRGSVVARAVVPNEGRVVGFGARSIYVVRKDEDDLQYLQRFPQ